MAGSAKRRDGVAWIAAHVPEYHAALPLNPFGFNWQVHSTGQIIRQSGRRYIPRR